MSTASDCGTPNLFTNELWYLFTKTPTAQLDTLQPEWTAKNQH